MRQVKLWKKLPRKVVEISGYILKLNEYSPRQPDLADPVLMISIGTFKHNSLNKSSLTHLSAVTCCYMFPTIHE